MRRLVISIVLASFVMVGSGSAHQDIGFTAPGGQAVNLDRGKVTVLLFSGAQDPQCRDGLKALDSLAERFRAKPVQVYWVCVNPIADFSDEQLRAPCGLRTSVQTVRDGNQSAFKRFSGKRAQLPTVVVLDTQGNPFGQARGGFNPNSDFVNELAGVIDGLLQRK